MSRRIWIDATNRGGLSSLLASVNLLLAALRAHMGQGNRRLRAKKIRGGEEPGPLID